MLLHLEEVKEDVHLGGLAEVPIENPEGFNESPTVGMKLGRGDIDLREKLPFKPRKRQAHPNAFEDCLIEVEKGYPIVGPFIPIDRLAWSTGKHSYVHVVPPSKSAMLVDAWFANVIPPILHGG